MENLTETPEAAAKRFAGQCLGFERKIRHASRWLKAPDEFPTIVCLCGSTRFADKFFEIGWELTLEDKIVLSIGVVKHAEHHGAEVLGQDVADRLDELHLRKIDLADEVWILNVGGYIGSSTAKEIRYAHQTRKPLRFLEPISEEVLEKLLYNPAKYRYE